MSWSYDSAGIHRMMLLDQVRDEAYRAAIEKTVKPGDVVLDFGAGSGILSMFAARSGAARVYAVEKTAAAHLAREIVQRNGLGDRVRIIQADIESTLLPERADVIVSEWLGTIGVDENLLAPLLVARDRWLKPGGKMIPERVTIWMAPVAHPPTAAQRAFYSDRPYGFDFSPVFDTWPHEAAWPDEPLGDDCLIADPLPLWTIDAYSFDTAQANLPFRASVRFRAARDGTVDALALWFRADLADGVELTNAPGAPPTHWKQYALPLERGGAVKAGAEIIVEYACIPAYPGYCHQSWSARVGAGEWQHHDTRMCRSAGSL
jgi:SAM-dependent methyltransferase